LAACAQAATALSASPSGEAAGPGSGGSASPPTKPSWYIASRRIASAAERSRRSQPRTVAAGDAVGEQRGEPLHPLVHGHVIDIDATLGQQLLDIAIREAVAQVPADRHRDHLRWEP
jgi:hypothetical protein